MQPVANATGKRYDAHGRFLGGRRLQTLSMFVFETSTRIWAGRICPDLGASRLVRSWATHCDGPLDLGPNPLGRMIPIKGSRL